MKLSLADKVAILYTRHGSQRAVAKAAGISRYAVAKILSDAEQGLKSTALESRDDVVGGLDHAIKVQRDELRKLARQQDLPFNPSIPVLAQRLELRNQAILGPGKKPLFVGSPEDCKALMQGRAITRPILDAKRRDTGRVRVIKLTPEQRKAADRVALLGDRVEVANAHWMTDKLRAQWLESQRKTGAYYQASIGSDLELPLYLKTAKQRISDYLSRGGLTTVERLKAEHELKRLNSHFAKDKVKQEDRIARIHTPYVSMDPRSIPAVFAHNIEAPLNKRHAPAVGEKGKLATTILLQVDTRVTEHETAARKPRKNQSGGRRRNPARQIRTQTKLRPGRSIP